MNLKAKLLKGRHVRDTAVLSIRDFDWPAVRDRLDFRLREAFA